MSFRPTPSRILSSLAVAFALVATVTSGGSAQTRSGGRPPVPVERSLIRATPFHGDLRRLPRIPPVKKERPEREAPAQILTGELAPIGSGVAVPSLSAPAPSPIASFEGLDFANWGDGHPPDPN